MSKLDFRHDGFRVVICTEIEGVERYLAEVRDIDHSTPTVRFLGPRATLQLDTAKRVVDYVSTRPWRSSS